MDFCGCRLFRTHQLWFHWDFGGYMKDLQRCTNRSWTNSHWISIETELVLGGSSPLSKWVITPIISGLTLLIPFITGVISHLLTGMSHQVSTMKVTITTIWTIFLHSFTGHKGCPLSPLFWRLDPKTRCKMKHVGTSPSSMIFLMNSWAISSDFPLAMGNDFPETIFFGIAHEIRHANHHFLMFTLW